MSRTIGIRFRLALTACVALFMFACAPAQSQNAFSSALASGQSLTLGESEDFLKISLSEKRDPDITRYGEYNRIVVTFKNTTPGSTLHDLLRNRRGSCVERFEVQTVKRSAEINSSGGVRARSTQPDMLLIAYVESNVEAEMEVTGPFVTLHFFRIADLPAQNRPLPGNSVEDISFFRSGPIETIRITTSDQIAPSIFEESDPHRVLVVFPDTNVPEKVRNQIFRYMETPVLFRLRAFNLGSLPKPYATMDSTREYHFVGFPSPLEISQFKERHPGLQTRDAIISIFPAPDSSFVTERISDTVYQITFTHIAPKSREVCSIEFEKDPVQSAEESNLYELIDEQDRLLITPVLPETNLDLP